MIDSPDTPRRPGQWPAPRAPLHLDNNEDQDPQAQVNRERARWHVTLGAIRSHLDEQPSPACVRAAARRWANAVIQLGDDIIRGGQ